MVRMLFVGMAVHLAALKSCMGSIFVYCMVIVLLLMPMGVVTVTG